MALAGGGVSGRALVSRLAGERALDFGKPEPVRLITITEEGRWVNLIHETLIRSKGLDSAGKPQPYWPTLWDYIEKHRERREWLDRIEGATRIWLEKQKNASYQWSHEQVREAVTALGGSDQELSAEELEFLGPIHAQMVLAELERPETEHRRRLMLGERLDILGDSRLGVGVDGEGTPTMDWRPIAGGNVAISILSYLDDANPTLSDPDNANLALYSPHRTNPTAKVWGRKKVSSFCIARYPVTVTQYRAFIGARDGWRDPAWWGDDLKRDPLGDTHDFGRCGNYPVVNVSWFDAVAFSRWLGRRVGVAVRLPDEWEWQLAATGGDDANIFPWGRDWDPEQEPYRANTLESSLRQPIAVGMYPAGVSAVDLLDMAGTVWEWCLNEFGGPKVTGPETPDIGFRPLRGGSWLNSCASARSAGSYKQHPDKRCRNVGFRLVFLGKS